jgi:AraC-like DNA-binding protein
MMESSPIGNLGLPTIIPGFVVNAMLSALQEEGIDPTVLGYPRRHDGALSARDYRELLEKACRVQRNPYLGLTIGQRVTEANLHVFGPVIVASPSLQAATRNVDALQRSVLGDSFWVLVEDGEQVLYTCLEELASRPLSDLALTLMFRCCERFVGKAHHQQCFVQFAVEPPRDLTPYERAFDGRVEFGATRSGLRFPRALLDLERPGTDAALAASLCELVNERFVPAPALDSWTSRVERALRQQKLLARVDVEVLAARWQLSARSLRRRLESEGVRMNELLDRARFERASQLLARGSIPVARLADVLGYGDSSAFQRAFKRWAGVGPAEYRARERTRRRRA